MKNNGFPTKSGATMRVAMALSNSTRIGPIFVTVAIATITMVVLVWWMGLRLSHTNQALIEAQRTEIAVTELVISLFEAESSQRGYLLTGDERYLQPEVAAIDAISKRLQDLNIAAASGLIDPEAVAEIRQLSHLRLERLGKTIEVFQRSGREAAIAEIITDTGRQIMRDLQQRVEEVQLRQKVVRETLQRRTDQATTVRTVSVVVGALLTLVFIAWAYGQLARDIAQRERTEAEIAMARRRLAGIVGSAMDAIISADEQQNIVLFNAAAEAMFICPATEALGTPLDRFIPARYRNAHHGHLRNFGETGQTTRAMGTTHMNLSGLRTSGEEFPIDASISQVDVGGHKIFTAVIRDITQRKRAEEELLRLQGNLERRVHERTADLAAANQELEAFGYSVSHDLRAPLRHVTGFVELLEKHAGPTLDEKGKRYVKTIQEASRRMGSLIDDLLTFSRIGRATLQQTEVDLRTIVDEVILQFADQTVGRRVEWKIGPLPRLLGDNVLLHDVMMNLLGNALKYSRMRDPAVIEIGSREENGEFVCFCRDNGIGFDMKFVDKLFGVFQRLHRAEEFEGTGIGLASVRRIIQRHGGRTWAEGVVNRGATIYFSFPAKEVVSK